MSDGQGMFMLMDVATVDGVVSVGPSRGVGPESSSASCQFHRRKIECRQFRKPDILSEQNRISTISHNWLFFSRMVASFFEGAVLPPFILNEMAASFSSQNRHDGGTSCRRH